MNIYELIKESAKELRERPSLFLPRLLTSLISSIWILGLLEALNPVKKEILILGLITFPAIFFLGVITPVVVAEMIKENSGIKKGILAVKEYIPRLLLTSLSLFFILTAIFIPAYGGLGLYMLTGSIVPLIIGVPLTLMGALIFIYGAYFLPITLTDNKTFESIKESFRTSKNNRREVTALIIISFVLLGLAAASSGALQTLGMAGFILGRLFSSVLSTYSIVISPKYYLKS